MNDLTRDSQKVICYIYKMFLEYRKEGQSKADAKRFEDDFYKQDKDLSKWHDSDISECLMELARNGYIKMYIGGDFDLLDKTIIYMENRFKNGAIDVLNYLTNFIP